MKSIFTFVIVAVLPLVAAAQNGPAPELSVPEADVKAICGSVPKGWTVTVKDHTVIIQRDVQVKLLPNPINAPPNFANSPPTPASTWPYVICVRYRPKLSDEEYAKLKKENESQAVKIERLREGLREARITHKFDDYLPDSPEQKKSVAEYRAEQQKIHTLPNYRSDIHALEISDNRHFTIPMTEQTEIADCAAAMKAICELFKPFPAKKAGDK
jgi:hypothetical protein